MSNMNPPAWFYYDDDDTDSGVLLRVCSGNDLEDKTKKCSKKQPPEYKRGRRFEIPDKIDEKRYSEMLWDFVIVDWKGTVDENDDDIECNMDNKIKLMRQSVFFASFIGKSLDKLNADIAGYQKDLEKN